MLRADGRASAEYRELSLSCGVLAQACGSARAVLGGGLGAGTEVLAVVSAEVCAPKRKHPARGFLEVRARPPAPSRWRAQVAVESSALLGADDRVQQALMAKLSLKLGAVLNEALEEDLAGKLCVVPGAYVWKLCLDVLASAPS